MCYNAQQSDYYTVHLANRFVESFLDICYQNLSAMIRYDYSCLLTRFYFNKQTNRMLNSWSIAHMYCTVCWKDLCRGKSNVTVLCSFIFCQDFVRFWKTWKCLEKQKFKSYVWKFWKISISPGKSQEIIFFSREYRELLN